MKKSRLLRKIPILLILAVFLFSSFSFLKNYKTNNADAATCDIINNVEPFAISLVDGNNLFILDQVSYDIKIVDTATNLLVETIPLVDKMPYSMKVSNDKLYVFTDNGVVIVDINTATILTTLGSGQYLIPSSVLINDKIYISNVTANSITIIDTNIDTILSELDVGVLTPGLLLLNGTEIYIGTYSNSDQLVVLDTNTDTVADSITVDFMSNPLTFSNSKIYVYNAMSDNISVIDSVTHTVLSTINDFNGLFMGEMVAIDSKIYVNVFGTNQLGIIDANTDSVISLIDNFVYTNSQVLNGKLYGYVNSNLIEFDTTLDEISHSIAAPGIFNISIVGTDLYLSTSTGINIFDTISRTFYDNCEPILLTKKMYSDRVELEYDEPLDEISIPDISDFIIKVNDLAVVIDSVSILDDIVTINISDGVLQNDSVTISYIPNADLIIDLLGNQATAFTDDIVTVMDTYKPYFVSGNSPYINNLVLNFNEDLDINFIPSINDFVVKINGNPVDILTVAIYDNIFYSPNKLIIYLTYDLQYNDVVTVDYTKPLVNPLKDPSGNEVDSFINASVTSYNCSLSIEDECPPILTEIVPVPTPGKNHTPPYTFNSSENVTIVFGGSCSALNTSANYGNNNINFNYLPIGTYSDCTIIGTDGHNNVSEPLLVSPFTIYEDSSGSCPTCINPPPPPPPPSTPGTIGNLVFLDKNKNGIFDSGDVGIPKVTVGLFSNNVLLKTEITSDCTTNSCANAGTYSFKDVGDGTYKVVVTDSSNVLKNYTNIKTANNYTDNVGKDPNGYTVTISSSATSNQTADFGYVGGELQITGGDLFDNVYLALSFFGSVLLFIILITKKLFI